MIIVKKVIFIICLMAFMFTSGYSARLALVDYQEVFANYKETKKVNDKLLAAKKDRQVKLDKVQTELKKREEDFIKLEKKLSDKEKSERRKEFQAELMVLREKLQRYQDDLRTLQKKLVGRLDREIKAAIIKVGKKEKCEMIIEKQSVYMGGRDITEKVIEFLNK